MIECSHCRKLFIPLFEDEPGRPCTQAMECASEVFERDEQKFLIGSFGSKIADGKLYKVLTNCYVSGTICDRCIDNGKNLGHFQLLTSDNYYGIDL